MSETWVDGEDYEDIGEAEDYEDIGEGDYDSEDIGEGDYDSDDIGEDFGEESRSARRRRERLRRARLARQRQIMLARQRQAQLRRLRRPPLPARRPAGAPRPSRPAIRAVRSLDLETKVGLDSLRRAVEESNRRANQANWAAVAGVAVNQGLDSFAPNLTNQYVRAGARFAPLLLLSPGKKRGGAQGFVTDPRIIGGASILGIALLHNFTSGVHGILITPPAPPVSVTSPPSTRTLVATAKDRLGTNVPKVLFNWVSLDPTKGTFTNAMPSETGDFQAIAPGSVVVEATAPNGVKGTLPLTIL
jgi:hypothetical protein